MAQSYALLPSIAWIWTMQMLSVTNADKPCACLQIEQLQNNQQLSPTAEEKAPASPGNLRAAAEGVAHTPAQGSHTPSAFFGLARGPEGGDPEDIVQRLLSALLDYENRSRQWSDERQHLQVSLQPACSPGSEQHHTISYHRVHSPFSHLHGTACHGGAAAAPGTFGIDVSDLTSH